MNLVYRVCRCDAMKRLTLGVSILVVFFGNSLSALAEEPRFVDHSLLIASEYPATWPSAPFPRFQITHQRTIGPESAYNIDVLLIDGNTGTQLDVPPHSVARPELNREKSGPLGLAYTDKIEPWQFGGEACVVDVRDLLDKASKASKQNIGSCDSAMSFCFAVTIRINITSRFQKAAGTSRMLLIENRPAILIPIRTAWSFWQLEV
jgi:kynurenine formamidase